MNRELLAFSSLTLYGCLLVLLVDLGAMRFYHRDEGGFTSISRYSFSTFFIERDYQHEGWFEEHRSFGKVNPQVAKYIMGASLWLHGYQSFEGIKPWVDGVGKRGNARLGVIPHYPERYAARLPVAILSAMTATMVGIMAFLTLAHAADSPFVRWLGGLGSVVFFMSDPIIWDHSHRAMLDMPVLFFVCLTFLLAIRAVSLHLKGFHVRSYMFSGLGALVFGLAMATKLNAALIGMAVAWVFALFFALECRERSNSIGTHVRRWLPHALAFLVLPLSVFIITNPYLYQNTFEHLWVMYTISDRVVEVAENSPDGLFNLQDRLETFVERASRGVSAVFRLESPVIDYLFILVGLFFLLGEIYRSRGNLLSGESVLPISLVAWSVVAVIGVLWWTPIGWYRYYLPSAPVLSVLQGLGLACGLLLLRAFFRKAAMRGMNLRGNN